MTSWAAWLVLLVVAVTLGAIATHFSVRTVRWFTPIVAVVLVIVVTAYGLNRAVSLGMPAAGPPDLQTAFAKGALLIVQHKINKDYQTEVRLSLKLKFIRSLAKYIADYCLFCNK